MRKREHRYSRKIRTLFLVICEGQTERAYVELLKRLFRLPIEIRILVKGANINTRVIQKYLNDLEIENSNDCKVFLIYDGDVPSTIEKIRQLNGYVILTNPCIELWFLIHVQDHFKTLTSSQIIDTLMTSHEVWKSYEKGKLSVKQSTLLLDCMERAINHARKLKFGSNPSTNMPDFIAALKREKNS